MDRVHVDVTELRATASKLRSLSPTLAPVAPRTPRGIGVYGFPLLTGAVESLVNSVDEGLRSSADLLARQEQGLEGTARDFEDFEDAAKQGYDAMLGRL